MSDSRTARQPYVRLGLIALAVLIAVCGVPTAVWIGSTGSGTPIGSPSSGLSVQGSADLQGPGRTRSAIRPEAGPKATHGPQRLRDFYLPPLDFDGVSLAEALGRVRVAYGEVCRQSGEQPLDLVFTLPPGVDPVVRTKTRYRTLESTVQLLAGVAKLTMKRHGREFRFSAPPGGDGRVVKREFDIPFGINGTDYLAEMGIVLAPETRVVAGPGSLRLETANAADLAAVGAAALSLAMDPPVSQKLTAKIVTLPAGCDLALADQSLLSDTQFQLLMRECASRTGLELMTLPSVLAKPEQAAKIEMVRELVTRSDDPGGGFETHPVGVVLDSSLHPLGFGHQVKLDLSVTTGAVDATTGRALIDQQAEISCETFATDAGTVVKVQTHPDGSRTVLMVSPALIGPTGEPAKGLDE